MSVLASTLIFMFCQPPSANKIQIVLKSNFWEPPYGATPPHIHQAFWAHYLPLLHTKSAAPQWHSPDTLVCFNLSFHQSTSDRSLGWCRGIDLSVSDWISGKNDTLSLALFSCLLSITQNFVIAVMAYLNVSLGRILIKCYLHSI
jgi:hypothetical protein